MQGPRSLPVDEHQSLLSRLSGALRREGQFLMVVLRDPLPLGLLVLTLLLAVLSCQVNRPFLLDVGRRPEEAYLAGFHAAERGEGQTFRWSTGEDRVRIPGLGSAPYHLRLLLAAPREPDQALPQLELEVADHLLLKTPVQRDFHLYSTILMPEDLPGGTLDLLLRSDTVTSSLDSRPRGVALALLEVQPAGRFPVAPPLPVLLWPPLTVWLAVLLARRLGWSRWISLGVGAGVAVALGGALAWARSWLAPGLHFLPLGLAVSWLAVVLGRERVRSLFARGGAELGPPAERALWSVVALFLAVRLAGSLHPALKTWDLCFHWHHLALVGRGQVLFTIVSGEWRGLQTLYLPSLYLVLAPFWAIFGGRLAVLKVAGVLLDTSSALLVAYIARRVLGRGQVAGLAALLYLAMPQSYIIFLWGIVANIFGQWLLLLVLAVAVSPAGRLEGRRTWAALAGLLVLAMLAHPGTVLLTTALLGSFLLVVLLAPLTSWPRRAVRRWVLAGLAAVVLAGLLYYSYFAGTMWGSLREMAQGPGEGQPTRGGILVRGPALDADLGLVAVEVDSYGEALLAGFRELATEAWVFFRSGPLLLAVAALAGYALERRSLVVRLAGSAFGVALFFAIVGLATNLYVRYMYFLLPFVAIGAAWWLDRLGRKGRTGRAAVAVCGLSLLLLGLSFWAGRVLYYPANCR